MGYQQLGAFGVVTLTRVVILYLLKFYRLILWDSIICIRGKVIVPHPTELQLVNVGRCDPTVVSTAEIAGGQSSVVCFDNGQSNQET